jgi:putative transposase
MSNSPGGRSSATPKTERLKRGTSAPSASSPLHPGCDYPNRKTPAHFSSVEAGNRSIIIFLTVCTKRRRPLLANISASELLLRAWAAADAWVVGRYVILPDHLPLFCAPNTFPPRPLKNWIGYWKNYVTRAWPNRDEIPIWQGEYWDRQVRRGESYAEKWDYVGSNPVRHRLVENAGDGPYRGELNVLQWHD